MDTFEMLLETVIRRVVREELAAAADTREPAVPAVQHVSAPREPLLYSVAEAAGMLSMSHGWVYDRINAGELAVVEFGSSRHKQRVSARELQRFIDSRTFGRRGQ